MANGIVKRDEVVCYFKELYNQKIHLLGEDVIECLIDKSLDIHPQGLEEQINKANDGDVLGFSSPDIDYRLEEQGSKSIECARYNAVNNMECEIDENYYCRRFLCWKVYCR